MIEAATNDGLTFRPVHKRISEHKRDFRNGSLPDGFTDLAILLSCSVPTTLGQQVTP